MEKRRSISAVFVRHQAICILSILLLFIGSGVLLYRTGRRNIISERTYQLQLAVNQVNARMGTVEDNLTETLTTIMNNYDGLWTVENQRKYFDKQQLSRLIAGKKVLVPELEYFFALRPGDFTVFQANETNDIFERLALKEYVEDHAPQISSAARDSRWALREVGGRQYLVECYYYSYVDIYVGVAVEPALLLRELINLADLDRGAFTVWDSGESEFSYFGADSRSGGVSLDSDELHGDLSCRFAFAIDYLDIFRNNILLGTLMWFIAGVLIIAYMNSVLHRTVIRPIQEVSGALRDIDSLTEETKLPEDAEIEEIYDLENALNTLLRDTVYSRLRLYSTEIEKKEQELSMLRAQLRPHFFLNAITTVNAMTYQDRSEDIRDYLMKLSGFLRYTLSAAEDMIPLGEETENIRNYFQMQEVRYPGKVMTFVDCAPEVRQVPIPRFLLLTIVENAFKYAVRVDDMMQLFIQCVPLREEGFSGVLVTVEDNGNGFTQEQIDYYNRPLPAGAEESAHIGITNVKRTLSLYYGRDDLLRISNAIPAGAHIEIRIPEDKTGEEKRA